MTVRLTIHRDAWLHHVRQTADAYGHGLVPVVKGNGYGFGRAVLHEVVRDSGAAMVCVGNVHELHDVPPMLTPVVLTPTMAAPTSTRPILTVGQPQHVDALAGWNGRVMVKLASSMQRYGVPPADLAALVARVRAAGLTIEAYALHLPLAGDDHQRIAEITSWLPHLEPGLALWVSHLTPASFQTVQAAHPDRPWSVRVGTALWHGVPKGPFLQLSADVVHTRPVHSGEVAGYRHVAVPVDGTLVAIAAGTAAGVTPLDHTDPSQRSPFHFARRRLVLLESPHMHTSLVVVPAGDPCPSVGDSVDVQRPLTSTVADELVWA
jgi:alanine racemase